MKLYSYSYFFLSQYRDELKQGLLTLPHYNIWKLILDGPEEQMWAIAKRALRDIYKKMIKSEMYLYAQIFTFFF